MQEFTKWLKEMDNMLYATRFEHSDLAFGVARAWLWPLFQSHEIEACLPYNAADKAPRFRAMLARYEEQSHE